jgi:hypothetical protein
MTKGLKSTGSGAIQDASVFSRLAKHERSMRIGGATALLAGFLTFAWGISNSPEPSKK